MTIAKNILRQFVTLIEKATTMVNGALLVFFMYTLEDTLLKNNGILLTFLLSLPILLLR